jgi:hypothetical protein
MVAYNNNALYYRHSLTNWEIQMHVYNSYLKGLFFDLNPPKHVNYEIGNTGIEVDAVELDGWWENTDGSEGGDLIVSLEDGKMTVADFDGASDLPRLVKADLRVHGIGCDF